MERHEVRATARSEVTVSPQSLRREGKIPAVVYGHGVQTRPLSLDAARFRKLWAQVGETTLVDLIVGEETPVKVLVQDGQRHPIKHVPRHVDLHQVKMTEKMTAEIPLVFSG